jgi:hypothetical protein
MSKLHSKDRHLLTLIRKDRNAEGWAKVSAVVWPLVQTLPGELVDLKESEDGGFVKLTDDGETVLDWT